MRGCFSNETDNNDTKAAAEKGNGRVRRGPKYGDV